LVLAQPRWGVDVGAAMLIRQAIIGLRDQGVAVLVISEELDELFMMCDRIAVLAKGRLSPAIPAHEATIDRIGLWMSGDFSTSGTAATIQEGTHHVPA
jgi:simple sugar transport system ATP-binding protein